MFYLLHLITTMVYSNFNRIEEHIWNLQESALQIFLERLSSPSAAANALSTFLPDTWKFGQVFNFLEQSWWQRLLVMTYMLDVKQLKEKANVPVEKATRLFGAPDPMGLLQDGEVYCAVQVNYLFIVQ
jgi:hypothetical protein